MVYDRAAQTYLLDHMADIATFAAEKDRQQEAGTAEGEENSRD